MSKKNIIIIFLVISNMVLLTKLMLSNESMDEKEFITYSFEGESEDIRISDGLIFISPNKQKVIKGTIQYTGNTIKNIKFYTNNFYLGKELKFSDSADVGVSPISFPKELTLNSTLGEVELSRRFNKNDLDMLNDNFYFLLKYRKLNGETGVFRVKLKVKELFRN